MGGPGGTSGGFGWVVVYLEKIELTELAELVYEAWRLTAPPDVLADGPQDPGVLRRAQ